MCVTNFTCILIENQAHSAVRVSVSSKSVFKNYLSAVHFCCVFGSFGTVRLYEESDYRDPKEPGSVTKKDVSDYILSKHS